MLAWSPILIQRIEIRALGFVLRKLQLNRHREAEVAPHAHDFSQIILYLSGEGWQSVSARRRAARAGDLFCIAAGTLHGFALRGRSRPLCLVLDYEVKDSARSRVIHRRLPQSTLNELHALLARVPAKGRPGLADYPAILEVVARLLAHSRGPVPEPAPPALIERVGGLLRSPVPLSQVAKALGYHPDHLSRRLRRESGMGLRDLRNRLLLEDAQRALLGSTTVAEAATRAGFEDPNYFARWFRRHTGSTPRAWKATGGARA